MTNLGTASNLNQTRCFADDAMYIKGSKAHFKSSLQYIPLNVYPDLVLKFGVGIPAGERLEKEARFYNEELRRAQGVMVPWFIGLFGTMVHGSRVRSDWSGDEMTTCLVTKFDGKSLPCKIRDLPAKQRYG